MFIFNYLPIYSGSIDGVVSAIGKWIRRNRHKYICVTGAHGVVEASADSEVFRAHKKAGLVVPDGMPLVWFSRFAAHQSTERIYGPDLFLAVCKQAEKERWKIFLYGTTPQTLTKLTNQIHTKFPSLDIVGVHSPLFLQVTSREDREIITKINKSKAHIVFVGLSTPKQELWMLKHVDKLNANVLIGVGAAFDFIARTKRQAPEWMRYIGLEWLYRLLQEPKRLLRRYIVIIPLLPYYFFRETIRRLVSHHNI